MHLLPARNARGEHNSITMKLDFKNSLLLALVFIVGVGVGVAVNLPALDTSRLNTAESKSAVSIMLDYGDGKVATYNNVSLTANESLFQAMEKLAKDNSLAFEHKTYEGLGALIEKIGTKKNGMDDRYWQYWVNNQKPEVGAGLYILQSGDIVEWKFIPFKGE